MSTPASQHFFGATHPGSERTANEDAFGIDPKMGVCVVADGMGGLSRGEAASKVAVDTILNAARDGLSLPEAFRLAHRRIGEEIKVRPDQRVGATAVALVIADGEARICWLGDSRAYLWRGDRLQQVTKDHSLVQEMLDVGAITSDEAMAHPYRNVVTRALGIRDAAEVAPAGEILPLRSGDRLLLCSDGLSSYLPEETIVEVLRAGGSDEDVANRLIERTLADTAAADNVTVIVVSLPGK